MPELLCEPLCQHCQQAPRRRPRGLCHGCHKDKEVRLLYPQRASKYNNRGVCPDFAGEAMLPPPAEATPGPAKFATLAARAAAGLALFHPRDRQPSLD